MKKKPKPKPRAFTHIKDLTLDPDNARQHTSDNVGLIADAMQEVGVARSIVIDEDGMVLAGEGALEAAAQAGITELEIVDVDGDELVAVMRDGLTPEQQARLALYDNRAGERATWKAEVLAAFAQAGLTGGMFTDDEIAALVAAQPGGAEPGPREEPEPPSAFAEPDESTDFRCPACGYEWSGESGSGE